MSELRRRPSSRLLVLNRDNQILLFRFAHEHGALAGRSYWATPGGAVEAGETFEDAARRELFEETGIVVDILSEPVAEREFVLPMPDGGKVVADERFFLLRVAVQEISTSHWTPIEREMMTDYRWWSLKELTSPSELIYPEDLTDILRSAGALGDELAPTNP